eukprot:6193657-Pleurochrysis_carterae.AAC.1
MLGAAREAARARVGAGVSVAVRAAVVAVAGLAACRMAGAAGVSAAMASVTAPQAQLQVIHYAGTARVGPCSTLIRQRGGAGVGVAAEAVTREPGHHCPPIEAQPR